MKPIGKDWTFRDYTLRSGICFFILFALFGGSGSVLALLPLIGSSLDSNVRRPMDLLVQWVGIHAFHLTGAAATFHVLSGSDSEMQWIAIPVMFAIALVAALIWRVFDRRNAHDLLGWLRLIVRLTLGVAMLRYGFIKVFPIQFPSPPLAVLNEQVGNASPTMLFWSLYGIRPHFVMLLGWIEVVAGLALFFSRTAFFGSVLTFLVMTNVALLDVTFDVPVKLYSLSLLVMSFVLLLPEIQGLRLFFFTGKTVTRNDVWSPRISPAGRNLLLGLEFLMVLLACGQFASGTHAVWKMKRQSVEDPPAFIGGWQVQGGGKNLTGADGSPIVRIFFDPNSDTYFRASNGILWRSRAIYDRASQRIRILYAVRGMIMFAVDQSDANHLVLKPVGPSGADITPLTLTRIPLPSTYPLLQDRIRWVSEFETLR